MNLLHSYILRLGHEDRFSRNVAEICNIKVAGLCAYDKNARTRVLRIHDEVRAKAKAGKRTGSISKERTSKASSDDTELRAATEGARQ